MAPYRKVGNLMLKKLLRWMFPKGYASGGTLSREVQVSRERIPPEHLAAYGEEITRAVNEYRRRGGKGFYT